MKDKYYEAPKIVFSSEPSYWSESEPDYKIRQNLLRGVSYDIIPEVPIDGKFKCAHFNTLASEGKLTDGVTARTYTYQDPAWNRFTRGAARDVIFDLGHLSAVDSWSVSMLHELSTLVLLPDKMTVYGSVDGNGWQKLCDTSPDSPKFDNDKVVMTGYFGGRYIVRYIKVHFKIDLHIYCEQFEVYGTKDISDAMEIVPEVEIKPAAIGYPKPESFHNVHNMALMYHCGWSDDDDWAFIREDAIRPLVGYYQNGELKDTFFDSYLFLPFTRFEFPDGSKYKKGWERYLYSQFKADCNLDAVNKVTGEIAKKLGIKDYKAKIFFSLLSPRSNITDFGDIDGTGSLNFTDEEDRRKAIRWMVDEHIRRYKEGGYENTELCGFYWFNEATSGKDRELVKYTGDYVRSLGYSLFWIPYYLADGFSDWKELGFDLACMQPNYIFQPDSERERLYFNAEICREKGMCVELEAHWEYTEDKIKRYLEYLEVGAETGYMNTVKIYYCASYFTHAAYSEVPMERLMYDYTYKFAKETLTPQEMAKVIADISF